MKASQARALFAYNADTGHLVWKHRDRDTFTNDGQFRRWNMLYAGKVAGCVTSLGYRHIRYGGKIYKAHHIVWLIEHGELPSMMLDHINGDVDDNRLCNLRVADASINGKNRRRDIRNKSGVQGVVYIAAQKAWRAYASIDRKQKQLGTFHDINAAIAARRKAEREFGYHPNSGRDGKVA